MAEIKFEDVRERILSVLQERNMPFPGDTDITLLDGFTYLPIQNTAGGSVTLGGRNIPSVVLLGQKTGRLYIVALKHLLPDLDLEAENGKN